MLKMGWEDQGEGGFQFGFEGKWDSSGLHDGRKGSIGREDLTQKLIRMSNKSGVLKGWVFRARGSQGGSQMSMAM